MPIKEEALRRIRAALKAGVAAGGKFAQADVERRISKPVVRDFAGNVIQRSAPGEPPRLDTGQLHGNVDSAAWEGHNVVGATVGVSRPDTPSVPIELEFGTERIRPRPFMVPAKNEFAARGGTAAIAEAIKAAL